MKLLLDFSDWAAKRRQEAGFCDDLVRICTVSHRVLKLPCGCKRDEGVELQVWQEFDPKTRKSLGFRCAMGKGHKRGLYPILRPQVGRTPTGHKFALWLV